MQKKFFILILSFICIFALTGCVQQFKYNMKEIQSNVFGLNREVTIYSLDGKPIKTISGKFKILYPDNNRMEFIKEDGRKDSISGYYTAIVEEK